jgi:hypothetical protein
MGCKFIENKRKVPLKRQNALQTMCCKAFWRFILRGPFFLKLSIFFKEYTFLNNNADSQKAPLSEYFTQKAKYEAGFR